MSGSLTVIAIGDVVGRPGREVLLNRIEGLRTRHRADLVIVNGENASGGFSINGEAVREFLSSGVDVITTGNHVWGNKDLQPVLEKEERLLRPANYHPSLPGRGSTVINIRGMKVVVMNLIGRVGMAPLDCPFRAFDSLVNEVPPNAEAVILDFHAETTAEKQAMGRYCDGRASLVYGTHTHVQTSDERILPGGTGYITDIGMTGSFNSVIGMDIDLSLRRVITQTTVKLEVAHGEERINGIIAMIRGGKTEKIERFND